MVIPADAARVETPDTALALMVTPPMLFEEAVGVIKLLARDVLVLLIVVAPDRAPVIARVETPDTALVLMVTPPT